MTPAYQAIACYLQGYGQREMRGHLAADDFEGPAARLWAVIAGVRGKELVTAEDVTHAINQAKIRESERAELHALVKDLTGRVVSWSKDLIKLIHHEATHRYMRDFAKRLSGIGQTYTMADAIGDLRSLWEAIRVDECRDPAQDVEQIAAGLKGIKAEAWLELDGESETDLVLRQLFQRRIYNRLYIVAGRPSMGKNILVDNLVCALSRKYRGLYVSWDNTREETAMKLKCMAAGVNYGSYRYGHDEAVRAVARHRFELPPIIVDKSMDAYQLRIVAESLKAKYPDIRFIVIDYFQNVRRHDPRAQTVEAYELACIEIKRLANDLGCAVILMSQVGRGVEKDNRGGRVSLADLKWCSALEQEAYYVVGIGGDRDSDKRTIDVLKNKDGALLSEEVEIIFGVNRMRICSARSD